MTEERARYHVPNQPPADPPPASGELELLRDMGLRLLEAEVKWRWYRDLWAATWAAFVATRRDNERE